MMGGRSTDAILLRIGGDVEVPLQLGFEDLAAFPDADQAPDVSRLNPARRGDGVTLDALLRRAAPFPGASRVILHADRDDFHVALPLDALRARGIVIYRLDGEALPAREGGPIRVMVRDAAACHADELDECANVKYLSRMEVV